MLPTLVVHGDVPEVPKVGVGDVFTCDDGP